MILYGIINKQKRIAIIGFAIILSVLLNGAFSLISTKLSLPFFLDSIFTIIMTAMFGLWPGLVTGLFSNIFLEVIYGFPGYLYFFAIVNMLTALVTHLHIRFGDFTKASNALWTIISLSIVNAAVGAVILSLVFDSISYQPFDAIVHAVIATGQSVFTAAFLGRILINFVDKGIPVLIAFLMYRYFHFRQQSHY